MSAIFFLYFSDFSPVSCHNKSMFINNLIKKPILPIAFLLTYLLIHQLEEKKIINLSERAETLKATSCRAVLVNLKRRVQSWSIFCENNNLTVEIKKSLQQLKNDRSYKAYLYRELANDIIFTAKSSPVDTLENVVIVRFIIKSQKVTIKAAIFGEDLVKFTTLKIKDSFLTISKNLLRLKNFSNKSAFLAIPLITKPDLSGTS